MKMEHSYQGAASTSSSQHRNAPCYSTLPLRPMSTSETPPSNNEFINTAGYKSRIRQLESRNLLSSREIIILSVSIGLAMFFIILAIMWWRRRRHISRLVHDLTQNAQEKVKKELPDPVDLEAIPTLGSIMVDGTLSFEISVAQQRSRVRSEGDDQSEDGSLSVINSEVSSMWDSTSQQWDNNYFMETEERGRQAPIRMLSTIASVEGSSTNNGSSANNSNSDALTDIDLSNSELATQHKACEVSTRGSI